MTKLNENKNYNDDECEKKKSQIKQVNINPKKKILFNKNVDYPNTKTMNKSNVSDGHFYNAV